MYKYLLLPIGGACLVGMIALFMMQSSSSDSKPRDESGAGMNGFSSDVLVYVGKTPIRQGDLDWAYDFHTSGIEDSETLTPFPPVGDRVDDILFPLKDNLMSALIERKLLFEYIKAVADFDLSRPELYTKCINEWRLALAYLEKRGPSLAGSPEGRNRLKSRICELDIIKHFAEQKVFDKVTVSDGEIERYYRENLSSFRQPKKVIIEQIVLASEREANKVRNRVKSNNFSELARLYSISPEAEKGGRLGPFAMDDMPRIFSVAFSMREGEVRGVLKSTYGFHIIKLIKKLPARQQHLEDVKDHLRAQLGKTKKEQEYQKWVELALNTVPIESPKPLW